MGRAVGARRAGLRRADHRIGGARRRAPGATQAFAARGHLEPKVPSIPFERLLGAWIRHDFAPRACREALERFIDAHALPRGYFAPAEIEHGGLAASDALLFDAFRAPDRFSFALRAGGARAAYELPAPAVSAHASLLRAARAARNAADLAGRLDLEAFPESVRRVLLGAYRERAPHGVWPRPAAPGLARREHASLVVQSATTSVVLDPQAMAAGWTTHGGRCPAEPSRWAPDAVAVTHTHDDHWSLASTLVAAGTASTAVIVPPIPRTSLLAPLDLEVTLRMAGQDVAAPAWWDTVAVGDIEIDVLPFYGEQPTQSRPGADPRLRNWGSCYRFQTPTFSALVLADSGVDPLGSAVEVAERSAARRGPVDAVVSSCLTFREGINRGLAHYALALPFERLVKIWRAQRAGRARSMTLGVPGVAAVCRAARARYVLPYAHGFRGLGRDPRSVEHGQTAEPRILQGLHAALRRRGAATEIVDWRPGDAVEWAAGRPRILPARAR